MGVFEHAPDDLARLACVVFVVVLGFSSALRAQSDGPLARSIARAAVEYVAACPISERESEPHSDGSNQSDWSRVGALDGSDIVLTLKGFPRQTLSGSRSGRRTVVRGTVSQTALMVLNLTDDAIPSRAKGALAHAASAHPEYFASPPRGANVRLSNHVRLEAGGVLVDNRKVVELDQVIERVDRSDVAEIARVHRAGKQGTLWGLLVGVGVGAAAVFAACGTNWTQETTSCGNLAPVVPFLYGQLGMVIGAGIGFSIETSTVVYRAP